MCTTTSKATLLANAIMNEEMRRVLHAFASDLAGSRNTAISETKTEVARKLMDVVFNIAYDKVKKHPFERYIPIIATKDDFRKAGYSDADFLNAYELIDNCGSVAQLINEINATIEDLDMEIARLVLEFDTKFINVSIRFK